MPAPLNVKRAGAAAHQGSVVADHRNGNGVANALPNWSDS